MSRFVTFYAVENGVFSMYLWRINFYFGKRLFILAAIGFSFWRQDEFSHLQYISESPTTPLKRRVFEVSMQRFCYT